MTMLAEHVDVVIGIDTHKHTHTAAVVAATTGAVLETITVSADPDGYGELVELADAHAALRAWAIEGTGTYGADLTRVLQETGELVHELDRPKRPKRRMSSVDEPRERPTEKSAAASSATSPATSTDGSNIHLTSNRSVAPARCRTP